MVRAVVCELHGQWQSALRYIVLRQGEYAGTERITAEMALPEMRQAAKMHFNACGFRAAAQTTVAGVETDSNASYPHVYWHGGAAWLLSRLYDGYRHTLDKALSEDETIRFLPAKPSDFQPPQPFHPSQPSQPSQPSYPPRPSRLKKCVAVKSKVDSCGYQKWNG